MRFIVSKEQLLGSLSDAERVVLKRLPLPEFFEISGEPLIRGVAGPIVHPKSEELAKKYPEIVEVLTRVEFNMFCRLNDGEADVLDIVKYTRNPRSLNALNLVAVHVKNIRVKFKENKIPFEIKTVPTPFKGTPSYTIKKV